MSDSNNGKWQDVASSAKTGKSMVIAFVENDGTKQDYYQVQMLDTNGSAEGAPVELIPGSAVDYSQPGVAWNPKTDGWLACFEDKTLDKLFCQQFNADGSLKGSVIDLGATLDVDYYSNINPVWSGKRQKFLVEFTNTDSDSAIEARWLDPATGSLGSLITVEPGGGTLTPEGGGQMAYSTESDTFLIAQRMDDTTDGSSDGPFAFLLDGSGEPVGTPIGTLASTSNGGSTPSVAYNKARDEFVVVWFDYSTGTPLGAQRIRASDGYLVDAPMLNTLDRTGYDGNANYRPTIAAHSSADQLLVTTVLLNGSTTTVVALQMAGDGATDPYPYVLPGQGSGERPRVTFNRYTCGYVITFAGKNADPSYQLFSGLYTQPLECPPEPSPSGSKPKLGKAGTPGAVSLKVRVRCATGTAPCRMKLSGSLKGGKGKLKTKTVQVGGTGAKRISGAGGKTVTLRYSDQLIRELRQRGGGRIAVRASQIGGSSRTIFLTVPSPVTG